MAKTSICELAAILPKKDMDELGIGVHEVGDKAFALSGTQEPVSRMGEKKIVYFCSFDHLFAYTVRMVMEKAPVSG